jgi:hypothetical protein
MLWKRAASVSAVRAARRARHAGAVAGQVLHRREEVLQRRRQAGRGVGQQVVDLGDLGFVGFEPAGGRLGGAHLGVQELVRIALDLGDLGAGADKPCRPPSRSTSPAPPPGGCSPATLALVMLWPVVDNAAWAA